MIKTEKGCSFEVEQSEWIDELVFSQEGTFLASLSDKDSRDHILGDKYLVRLFSCCDGKEILRRTLFDCKHIYFGPGNQNLLALTFPVKRKAKGFSTEYSDYRLSVVEVRQNKTLASFEFKDKPAPFNGLLPWSVAVEPITQVIAVIYDHIEVIHPYEGGDIFLWGIKKGFLGSHLEEISHMRGRIYFKPTIEFSPDGKLIASTHSARLQGKQHSRLVSVVEVWDVQTANLVRNIEIPETIYIHSIYFGRDRSIFVSNIGGTFNIGSREPLILWSEETGKVIEIDNPEDRFVAFDLNPDGKSFATASEGGQVKLWSIPEGQQIGEFYAGAGIRSRSKARNIKFSPDGKSLAVGATVGSNARVQVWTFE